MESSVAMIRFRTYVAIGFVILLGCASTAPLAPDPVGEPEPQPIQIGAGGSRKIAFTRVLYRIPYGERIGAAYTSESRTRERRVFTWDKASTTTDAFHVVATDRLKHFGYTAVDLADSLFGDSKTVSTELALAAIISRLDIANFRGRYGSDSRVQEVELDIEFQLYDAVRDELLLSRQYTASARESSANPEAESEALIVALDRLLADQEFVALVAPGTLAVESPPAGTVANTSIHRCASKKSVRLPADMGQLTDAVVVIRVGGGRGSGVIVSDDGYVLTAAHLVNGLDSVTVRLANGLELDGEVLRVSSREDVALVRVPGRGHSCVAVGDGSELAIGGTVYAIGSPPAAGFSRAVTRGIVSGYQEIGGVRLIQIDASVNSGNSGGPLIDDQGRVRGIVSSKLVGTGIEGIGFAVPVAVLNEHLGIRWE